MDGRVAVAIGVVLVAGCTIPPDEPAQACVDAICVVDEPSPALDLPARRIVASQDALFGAGLLSVDWPQIAFKAFHRGVPTIYVADLEQHTITRVAGDKDWLLGRPMLDDGQVFYGRGPDEDGELGRVAVWRWDGHSTAPHIERDVSVFPGELEDGWLWYTVEDESDVVYVQRVADGHTVAVSLPISRWSEAAPQDTMRGGVHIFNDEFWVAIERQDPASYAIEAYDLNAQTWRTVVSGPDEFYDFLPADRLIFMQGEQTRVLDLADGTKTPVGDEGHQVGSAWFEADSGWFVHGQRADADQESYVLGHLDGARYDLPRVPFSAAMYALEDGRLYFAAADVAPASSLLLAHVAALPTR